MTEFHIDEPNEIGKKKIKISNAGLQKIKGNIAEGKILEFIRKEIREIFYGKKTR